MGIGEIIEVLKDGQPKTIHDFEEGVRMAKQNIYKELRKMAFAGKIEVIPGYPRTFRLKIEISGENKNK